jgi:hypothetical protein
VTTRTFRQGLDDSWVRRFYIDRLESPRHVNTLAASDGEIFTPAIFTAPGGQLIRARDHFQRLKVAQGDGPVKCAMRRSCVLCLIVSPPCSVRQHRNAQHTC